jgi:hypothetical protein
MHQQFLISLLYGQTMKDCVRFEVFTAVTMKNAVFCDVAPYSSWVTDVWEERINSIFRVEKSASEKPA